MRGISERSLVGLSVGASRSRAFLGSRRLALVSPAIKSSGGVIPDTGWLVQKGDLLLVIQGSYNSGSNVTLTGPSASGLTFIPIAVSGVSLSQVGAYYTISPDSTPRVITHTTSASGHATMLVIRGANVTTPVENASPVLYASTSAPTVSGLTSLKPSSMAFAIIGTRDDNTPTVTTSGWTERLSWNPTTATSLCIATKPMPLGGDTGDVSFNYTVNGPDIGVSITFAINA